MNDNKGQTIFLSVIGIATLLVAIIGATFAYFTTTINNEGNNSGVNATTARLSSITANGTLLTDTDIYPGWTKSGTVTLEMSAGTQNISYECYVQDAKLEAVEGTTLNASATLADFYVKASGTAAEGGSSMTPVIAETTLGTEATNTNRIKIAEGVLVPKSNATTTQEITYTFGLTNKTDTEGEGSGNQNYLQGTKLTANVRCSIKDSNLQYTDTNKPGV